MKIFLLQILLLVNVFAVGQSFAPIGSVWTFGTLAAFAPGRAPLKWITTKDTTVLGKKCNLTERQGGRVVGDLSKKFISYEDSGTVYWYNEHRNQFSVFIDFKADSGDSWISYYDLFDTCDIEVFVDSTDFVNINGILLKQLFVRFMTGSRFKITEHLGFQPYTGLYPGESVDYYCNGWIEDMIHYYGLRCYEDSIIGFYNSKLDPSCDYNTVGVDENSYSRSIKVYPNPANRRLKVQFNEWLNSNFVYRIFNSQGLLKLQGELDPDKDIDISQLENGIYIFWAKTNSATFTSKFVKNGFD